MILSPTSAGYFIMPSYTSGELMTIFGVPEVLIPNICMFSFVIA
jgi:hypothetical protein